MSVPEVAVGVEELTVLQDVSREVYNDNIRYTPPIQEEVIMSVPQHGQRYFTATQVRNDGTTDENTTYITVAGSRMGVLVDAKGYSYGQVFTTREKAENHSWLWKKRENLSAWAHVKIVEVIAHHGDFLRA